MSRSRRELSNAYFLAKFGFDTAENEPCQVCPIGLSVGVRAVDAGAGAEERPHAPLRVTKKMSLGRPVLVRAGGAPKSNVRAWLE